MVLSSWWSQYESSHGSSNEHRTAPTGCRPSDKSNRLQPCIYLSAAIVNVYTHRLGKGKEKNQAFKGKD